MFLNYKNLLFPNYQANNIKKIDFFNFFMF